MSPHFHQFWSQFWLRDTPDAQLSNEEWQSTLDDIDNVIPQQPPLDLRIDDPQCLWDSIHRLKSHRAPGIDGWRSEELQSLTPVMIADLSGCIGLAERLVRTPHAGQNVTFR